MLLNARNTELHPMERTFRTLAFGALLALGQHAFAQQPYTVIITGTVQGCPGNTQISIVSLPGTSPSVDISVPVLPPSCTFTAVLNMATQGGGFTLSTPCQGAMLQEVIQYQLAPIEDTTMVTALLNCGPTLDCLGVPGGSSIIGTPCTTANSEPGVFNMNCDCVPFSAACTACFTVEQDTLGAFTPFVANFFSCSSSVGGTYTLNWEMPDGSGPSGPATTYTFPGPGVYEVCLWMVGNTNNCTSTFCDSVMVDENGVVTSLSNVTYDCLQIPNGPNMPGTACTNPATGETGLWSADCQCLPDTSTTGCQAGFWVIQAYEGDSLNGEVTPIPNEVWVWNLSSSASTTFSLSGATTNGSNLLIIEPGCATPQIGATVAGTGIPWGTVVISVINPTAVTLSNMCTATATGIYTFTQADQTFAFVWDFGDGTTSTEAYPTHVYATGGPYQLCLTMTDGACCTSTYCDEVSIDENGIYNGMVIDGRPGSLRSGFTIRVRQQVSTGMQEAEALNELRTWPNPVSDHLNLSFRSTLRGTVQLQLVDVNGRVHRTTNATFTTGDNRIELSTAELPAGLYLLRMEQAGHAQSVRFVKD
jgi:PKD repeat protein